MKRTSFAILALLTMALMIFMPVIAQETLSTTTVVKTPGLTQATPSGFAQNTYSDYTTTVVIKNLTSGTADTSNIYRMYSHVGSYLIGARLSTITNSGCTVTIQGAMAFHTIRDSMKFVTVDTLGMVTSGTTLAKSITTIYPFIRFIRANRNGAGGWFGGEVYVYPKKAYR